VHGSLPNLLHFLPRSEFPLGESSTLLVQWGAVLGASLTAAVWDLRSRRIPNALTLPLFIAGVAFNAWVGGITAASLSMGGAAVAALPFVILFLYAGGGAGDAKLMGAIGAWLGLAQGVAVLLAVVIAGAVLGLAQAAFHKKFKHVTERMRGLTHLWFASITSGQRPVIAPLENTQALQMPYGVSIFTGVIVAAGVVLCNA
jgi:prepilin peptidase CpaA